MELEVLIAQTNNKSKNITFLWGCPYCIIMHISGPSGVPLAWNLNLLTGVQPLRAVTVSLLHWFSGASYQMAFWLKLQLDLFIERIGCTGDFRSKYKCSSCPSLLRFVEARGLEKPAKIDDDRSGVFLHKLWHESWFHPCLHFFSPSLPPTKTGWNGLKSLPEIKKDSNYKWGK